MSGPARPPMATSSTRRWGALPMTAPPAFRTVAAMTTSLTRPPTTSRRPGGRGVRRTPVRTVHRRCADAVSSTSATAPACSTRPPTGRRPARARRAGPAWRSVTCGSGSARWHRRHLRVRAVDRDLLAAAASTPPASTGDGVENLAPVALLTTMLGPPRRRGHRRLPPRRRGALRRLPPRDPRRDGRAVGPDLRRAARPRGAAACPRPASSSPRPPAGHRLALRVQFGARSWSLRGTTAEVAGDGVDEGCDEVAAGPMAGCAVPGAGLGRVTDGDGRHEGGWRGTAPRSMTAAR